MAAALVMLAALVPAHLTAGASGTMEIEVSFTVPATEENPRTFRAYKLFDVNEDAGGGYGYVLNQAFAGFRYDAKFEYDYYFDEYRWGILPEHAPMSLYEHLYTLLDADGAPLPAAEAALRELIDRLMFYVRFQPELTWTGGSYPQFTLELQNTPLQPDGIKTVTDGDKAVITGLEPGYYLITGSSGETGSVAGDPSVGVFALMTFGTSPSGKTEIHIHEKADGRLPVISKNWDRTWLNGYSGDGMSNIRSPYQDDNTGLYPSGEFYGFDLYYHVGEPLKFNIDIDISGWDFLGDQYLIPPDDFVFTVRDAMTDGFTLMPDTVAIACVTPYGTPGGISGYLNSGSYLITDGYVSLELYPEVDGEEVNGFNVSFNVPFWERYRAHVNMWHDQNWLIRVTYFAYLNENAVSAAHEAANPGGTNVAFLDYGSDPHDPSKYSTVPSDPVHVGTEDISIFKYYGSNTGLAGAVFGLQWGGDYRNYGDFWSHDYGYFATYRPLSTEYKKIQDGSKTSPSVYRPLLAGETPDEIISPESGMILIRGLGPAPGLLEEAAAPQGYTDLPYDVRFELDWDGVIFPWIDDDGSGNYKYFEFPAHVDIENRRTSPFPETGGPGTSRLPLYIAGMALLAVTGTALLIRRRTGGQVS